MRQLGSILLVPIVGLLAAGCGGGSTASSPTTAPTRTSLVVCLTQKGVSAKKTTEMGFTPPGGPLLVGPDGSGFVVGVFPDPDYAKAQADTVISIASSYVGKTDAEKNVHVVGDVVWFPQHSPFTGQRSAALDACLSG